MKLYTTSGRALHLGPLLFFILIFRVHAAKPPNILLLVAGDLGTDLRCYGNTGLLTSNIDRLAEEGVLCRNAFVTSPQNTPSLISILTGKYPHTTGTEDSCSPLTAGHKTLVHFLKEAGYLTGYTGDPTLFDSLARPFEWMSPDYRDFHKFLGAVKKKPFFFLADLQEPARPFRQGTNNETLDESISIMKKHLADDLDTRDDIDMYYKAISHLDSVIGLYTAALKLLKKERNTLVIFISKNGAPFPREKGTLYDTGIRVPLIFSGYAVTAHGIDYDGQISSIDLFTTIANICEIAYPSDLTGLDFSQMLQGNIVLGHDYIFSERNWDGMDEHIRCIRTEDYKLIVNAYIEKSLGLPVDILHSPSWTNLLNNREGDRLTAEQSLVLSRPRPQIELYDLQHDPGEYANLAGNLRYSQIVQDLIAELNEWMEISQDFPSNRRTRADQADRLSGEYLLKEIPPLENITD
ncbi:MAG TPA: sulfatase-like hydrolase/transferase [Cyclobacteriaceae bacterium]|nr:sulfatase-like hydrolase/transferase [Cyclobacteriaceae bacterium]